MLQRIPTRRRVAPWLPLVLGALGATAQAETSPYYLGASLGYGHDSNVFRKQDGALKQSANILNGTLLAGIDQPIGRQRIFADASVARYDYNGSSLVQNLGYTGYGLNAGLDWETINKLSGNVKLGAQRRLAAYADQQGTARNLEDNRYIDLVGRLGAADRSVAWLEAGLGWSDYTYSIANDDRERSTWYASFGGRYRQSGSLVLGAGLRHSEGKRTAANIDDFKRWDLDLLANWKASGLSNVVARVSFGNANYNNANQDNAKSNFSGALGWDWQATGKILMTTRLVYDTENRDGAGQTNTSNVDTFSGGDKTTSLELGATYAATAKINANAGLRFAHRSLDRTSNSGSDNTTVLSLGATYLPTRSTELGCTLGFEKRNSSNTALSQPYDANNISCYGRIYLR